MLKQIFAIGLAVLLLPIGSVAVRFVPLSVEDLAAKAQVVIHGTVREKLVERDDAGRVYTKVRVTVAETWKGAARAEFTVVQAGGTLGERSHAVDGQEPLEIGEEVVLFLVLNQREQGLVLGLFQGKFKVREQGGVKRVQNIVHGTDPKAPLKLAELRGKVKGGGP